MEAAINQVEPLRLSLERRLRCPKMPFFFFSSGSDSTLPIDAERGSVPGDIGERKDDGAWAPALSFRRGVVIDDEFELERGSGYVFERLGVVDEAGESGPPAA
jgi:hypothetical protein